MPDCVKVMIVIMIFVPELNCIIASRTLLTKFTSTALLMMLMTQFN